MKIFLILLVFLHSVLPAQQRQIAVTFDDLPFVTVGGGTKDTTPMKTWTEGLLKKLNDHKIPAVGFVNSGKIFYGNKENKQVKHLLQMWLDYGFELGNHTYGHKDAHKVPWEEFREDIVKGEPVLKEMLAKKGKKLRYFRHPYLHTGNTLKFKTAVAAFLAKRGYTVAPVTIDNSEWIFARAYHNAVKAGNKKQMKQIVDAYIPYMENTIAYYEDQSRRLFGREIKQVLLLHANELNADHFEALAKMIKKRGYIFITLDEAIKDPAYGSADKFTGRGGISWIHRWALTKGKRGAFFKGEPEAPAFIKKLTDTRYE